ncbi:MAG: NUDIX hydrolase [Firmicutes bacterium]|nr:NUDIX hydrolase [Bacillota bacterium]
MEKVNKKGQNFAEFMAEYAAAEFPKTAATVDNVVFAGLAEKLGVLLIQRDNFPDIYDWALPGGFIDSGETAQEAAARELFEEAGVEGVELEPCCTVSTPNRDPRGNYISSCFMCALHDPAAVSAGDDALSAKWFEVDYAAKDDIYELVLKADGLILNAVMRIVRDRDGKIDIDASEILQKEGIAFDHAKIILFAIETL